MGWAVDEGPVFWRLAAPCWWAGGPEGGWTGKARSDPESLSKSLSSASFRSWKTDLGTFGTSSRNVLTSARSKLNTSANL